MEKKLDGLELKRRMREAGVFGYQVAAKLGISESDMSRKLRNPTKAQAEQISAAIGEICKQRAAV